MPKLLSAFSQKGAAIPIAAMITPPSAGPYGPAHIKTGAVGGHCCLQIPPWHELRDNRLPSRCGERACDADQKNKR